MDNKERPSEIERAFENWIDTRGIEVALFDLDDTLIDTNSLFKRQEEAFFELCNGFIEVDDFETMKSSYQEVNTASFALLGASPKKWDYIMDELSKKYGHDRFREGLHLFQQIYTSVPELFEGAKPTLEILKKTGVRMGLITHAIPVWTDLKVDTLGLREYFEHIKVIDVDEHRFKSAVHWQEILDKFEVDPIHVMAVGDNIRGDIGAAHEIGIRTLALLPAGWHVFAEGDIPENVLVVDKITNLIPSLIEDRKKP